MSDTSQSDGHGSLPHDGQTPPAIPDHVLLRRIGKGSYGEVWLALNAMKKWTAVKIVYRRAEDDGHAYEQEFRGLKRYDDLSGSDGSLMPIKDVGRNDAAGFFHYAMELADDATTRGPLPRVQSPHVDIADAQRVAAAYKPWTLSEELKSRGRLPPQECIAHGIVLCTALEHIHQGKLVHRDIKPSNIIFVNSRPKLADVGLIAATDATLFSLAGTSGFIPDRGAGEASGDVFALGKVLYLMATGRSIHDFPKEAEDSDRLGDEERRNLAELQAVYDRACAAAPAERHPSPQALRKELEKLQRGESMLDARRQAQALRKIRIALIAIACAVILAIPALWVWFANERADEQDRRRQLLEIQASRSQLRSDGWFDTHWSNLQALAAVRLDDDVVEQASATLAGLDARVIQGHTDIEATSAVFGPNGSALISAVNDRPAMLMDTNGSITELPVRGEGAVCWPPDGVPLFLSAETNRLELRDAVTGSEYRHFPLPDARIAGGGVRSVLAISRDGSVVAAGTTDRVYVWRTITGESAGTIPARASALAISPDGSLIAVGGTDGRTHVHAVRDLTERTSLPPAGRGSPITCLAFGRDPVVPYNDPPETNRWVLATGDQGAEIVLWDWSRGVPRVFCRGSTWAVSAIAFTPDGQTMATSGRNQPYLWDTITGHRLLSLHKVADGDNPALAFDFTGNRLLCGGMRGDDTSRVSLWRIERDRGIRTMRGLGNAARRVWFEPECRRIAALSDSWHVAVWNVISGDLLFLLETPVGTYADEAGGCFVDHGHRFAFASGREACLYDIDRGSVLRRWPLARGGSEQLQVDARGRLLLLRKERDPIEASERWRLYELTDSQRPVLLHESPDSSANSLAVGMPPGGTRFFVWTWGPRGERKVLRGYDVETGKQVWETTTDCTGWGMRVLFDPTGHCFAYDTQSEGHYRQPLVLRQLSDFAEIRRGWSPRHKVSVHNAIGPVGRTLAADNLLLLGNTQAIDRVILPTDRGPLGDAVSFSPDGRLFAWGCDDGSMFVADIQEVQRRLASLAKTDARNQAYALRQP